MIATRPPRANTPERWRAALKRAMSEGVEVRQLQGSGLWIATSASDPNTAYEVSPWECECQAGQFDDPVCKHRAALLVKLGRLKYIARTRTPHAVACPHCNGTGIRPERTGQNRNRVTGIVACGKCDGLGFSGQYRAA